MDAVSFCLHIRRLLRLSCQTVTLSLLLRSFKAGICRGFSTGLTPGGMLTRPRLIVITIRDDYGGIPGRNSTMVGGLTLSRLATSTVISTKRTLTKI